MVSQGKAATREWRGALEFAAWSASWCRRCLQYSLVWKRPVATRFGIEFEVSID